MRVTVKNAMIQLEGDLSIDDAHALHQSLLHLKKSGVRQVVFHLEGVSQIDTALLQLLLVAKRSFEASEQEILFRYPSSAFLQENKRLGNLLPL
ncbi:STAS domain-containing protein [Magnetococcales bacterium HHB-1]